MLADPSLDHFRCKAEAGSIRPIRDSGSGFGIVCIRFGGLDREWTVSILRICIVHSLSLSVSDCLYCHSYKVNPRYYALSLGVSHVLVVLFRGFVRKLALGVLWALSGVQDPGFMSSVISPFVCRFLSVGASEERRRAVMDRQFAARERIQPLRGYSMSHNKTW